MPKHSVGGEVEPIGANVKGNEGDMKQMNLKQECTGLFSIGRCRLVLAGLMGLLSLPAAALNIVLTNDDGWESVGIQAMKAELLARGHNVILIAPSGEQSGSGAAINLDALLITKERDDQGAQEFSAGLSAGGAAEPATSAMVGIDIATKAWGQRPDLLISGINAGANIGAATQLSGTVGATIVAIAGGVANAQVPAIGISTDDVCDPDDGDPQCAGANAAHYARVAGFIGRMVEKLQDGSGRANAVDGLLPAGVALSVNYPPLSPEEIAGVKVVEQGRDLVLSGNVIGLSIGCFGDCAALEAGDSLPGGINGAAPAVPMDTERNDSVNFINGYITIVPIEADYTAQPENLRSTKSIVHGLGVE